MSKEQLVKTNSPEWFLQGSVYQVNPRTFSREGTIAAVEKELPFLKDLGFKIIYLCPVFEEDDCMENRSKRQIASCTGNPKNPYRMNDYFTIDEEYGTMNDLRALVKCAHELDMKVLLDLVYCHIGPNAPILKEFPDFAVRDESGKIVLSEWNFPLLNYKNQALREYLWCNMTYYVGVIGVDGFRCDVADGVPLDFWLEGRKRIRAIKPDAVMISEGWNFEYLIEGFDASYSFSWHETIYETVQGGASAERIRSIHETQRKAAPVGSVMMRDIDNHDTVTDWPERTEIAAGHQGMELIEVLNYIIDGVPMVYAGNELGDSAKLSMFANRFYMGEFQTTDRSIRNEPHSVRRQTVIRRLNAFRRDNLVLSAGDTFWIDNSCPENVLSFVRRAKNQTLLFVGNLSRTERHVKLDFSEMDVATPVFQSENAPKKTENGWVLPAWGYVVLQKA